MQHEERPTRSPRNRINPRFCHSNSYFSPSPILVIGRATFSTTRRLIYRIASAVRHISTLRSSFEVLYRVFMGSLCACCLGPDDIDEINGRNSSGFCYCFSGCLRWCMRMSVRTSRNSTGILISNSEDASLPDPFQTSPPLPLPLPYDADARHFRNRENMSIRREKSLSYQGDAESARRMNDSSELVAMVQRRGNTSVANEEEEDFSKSSFSSQSNSPENTKKLQSSLSIPKTNSLFSLNDEDCCPTCFEGYSEDNPKILTECDHHFHLGCIYEWMERSNRCPVCDKEMVFFEGN